MCIINIVDAPCGYGKTSWAIQYMNNMSVESHQFIFVTPFLGEVDRIKNSVTNRKFYDPISQNGETKIDDLHNLIEQGKDICTTHALFHLFNEDTIKLLELQKYTLILDEVTQVIEQIRTKKDDTKLLEMAGTITVERRGGLEYVKWSEKHTKLDTQLNKIKHKLNSNNVMNLKSDNSILIWNYPSEVFSSFKDVFILTYLFKGQLQRAYFDLHSIGYKYLSVKSQDNDNYELVPYTNRTRYDKSQLRLLINVYEGHLNDIGNSRTALSKTWFESPKNNKSVLTLQKNARNYLQNICGVTSDAVIWTTIKGDEKKGTKKGKIQSKVAPRGYSKQFVAMNTRATNSYKEKSTLAYLVNRFMNPIEKRFFEENEIKIDEEVWAVSELIQWIWRSRIRDGKSIDIYIPSKRMRDLLWKYLNSEVYEKAPDNAITNELSSDWNI